jgi:hypothetical protein
MKYLIHWLVSLLVASMAAPAAAQMGPPATLSARQFAAAATGQNVVLAVRVTKSARTTLDAELLDHLDGESYRATGKSVTLYLPAETPFVMGSSGDVKSGAVLAVYAVTTTAGHADVKKVVVITPYVSVK